MPYFNDTSPPKVFGRVCRKAYWRGNESYCDRNQFCKDGVFLNTDDTMLDYEFIAEFKFLENEPVLTRMALTPYDGGIPAKGGQKWEA